MSEGSRLPTRRSGEWRRAPTLLPRNRRQPLERKRRLRSRSASRRCWRASAPTASVVPIPTAPAVAACGPGRRRRRRRARLIALALQRSKEQLRRSACRGFAGADAALWRADRPESVGAWHRTRPSARASGDALENGRWSIAQAIGEASHSVRPSRAVHAEHAVHGAHLPDGPARRGRRTLIVDEVAGDVVTSGVLATRARRAFVHSSTAENVHTSLGSLRGAGRCQFWFEARMLINRTPTNSRPPRATRRRVARAPRGCRWAGCLAERELGAAKAAPARCASAEAVR